MAKIFNIGLTKEFVLSLLDEYPYLSSAQAEDRSKEHSVDLPLVDSKTIYNFFSACTPRGRYFQALYEQASGF